MTTQRAAFERALSRSHRRRVRVDVMDDPRRMLIIAEPDDQAGILRVSVNRLLLSAPRSVRRAAIAYIARGDLSAWSTASRWIDASSWRLPPMSEPRGPLRTAGSEHDLAALLDRVRIRCFDGMDLGALRIAWGRRTRGPRTGSIKLGSCCPAERLIRVHPALDAAWVPAGFVEAVIAHEILHHTLMCTDHPPRFRLAESSLPEHGTWAAWEREHIDDLLAA